MFSFNTIKNFDNHIEESIPNYDLLFNALLSIAPFFTVPDTQVIDLGCSTGRLLKALKHDGAKIGIDTAENLLPRNALTNGTEFKACRIEEFYEYENSSLVTSIFTLQFLPRHERQLVLNRVYDGLDEGGAFIWAEKVYAETGIEQDIQNFAHYDFKQRSFTAQDILSKEQDLRSLMRPNTTNQNLQLAKNAGFTKQFLIWKFFNFEAWVFIK